MSEAKFTKGEWVINKDCWVGCSWGIDMGSHHCAATVVTCFEGGGDDQLTRSKLESNAHLIAAAPEMYEEIENEIEFLRELRSEAHTPYMAELFDNRIADKVNLLAKARGEK